MSFVAEVTRIPLCDFCSQYAIADGRLKTENHWAYMCEWHFEKLGLGLGTGLGQVLVLEGTTK